MPARPLDRARLAVQHAIDPHRPRDILELLLAGVLEGDVELAIDVDLHPPRDADPAGVGQRLQPGRDVDAVAPDVVAIHDDVADIDADAEFDPLVGRYPRIVLAHGALEFDRAANRRDHARELHQQAIAGDAHDAAAMLGDLWIDERAPVSLPLGERAGLVGADKPAVAGHVGDQDGRQPSLDTPAAEHSQSQRRVAPCDGVRRHDPLPHSSDPRQERRRRTSVQPKGARGEPVAEMNRQGLGALPYGFARNKGQPGDRVNSRSPEDAGPE